MHYTKPNGFTSLNHRRSHLYNFIIDQSTLIYLPLVSSFFVVTNRMNLHQIVVYSNLDFTLRTWNSTIFWIFQSILSKNWERKRERRWIKMPKNRLERWNKHRGRSIRCLAENNRRAVDRDVAAPSLEAYS